MTPKQKAFELYFKFYRDIIADNDKAKQSALIAVDEIGNSIVITDLTTAENQFKYWEEVKQEIENL